MLTIYRILSLTILTFFILAMTLMPMYSSMVTFKSREASQGELSLNVPFSKDDATTSYY